MVWVAFEYIRLNNGRVANLEERVSTLSASMLMCWLPQIPSLLYIAFFQEIIFPADFILSIFMLALLLAEFTLSFLALRKLIQKKTTIFYQSCREQALKFRSDQLQKDAEVVYVGLNGNQRKTDKEGKGG